METILHIGMPKTGTTSLQRSLANHRRQLLEHGVLYPSLSKLSHAHHTLAPLLEPANTWGRVKASLGPDPLTGAQDQWDSVLSQIEQSRPKRMVLSTEALFDVFPGHGLARFSKLVGAISSRVTVVAYVREPAKYYSSILMERAKRTIAPRPAEAIAYREPIEQFQRVLGADAKVRVFERDLLHQGDITNDFLHRILGLEWKPSLVVQGNVSMRPEAAAIFQRYMQGKTANRRWGNWEGERQVVNALVRIGREVGRVPTSLRPDVAEVVTYSSKDLLWLRDEFRIVFDGIDYDRLATSWPKSTARVRTLRDAFDFHEDVYAEILARVQAELPEMGLLLTDPAS